MLLTVHPVTLTYRGGGVLTPELEEGFCEVVRAAWIIEHGMTSAEQRLRSVSENSFDTYRKGFLQTWPGFQRLGSLEPLLDEILESRVEPMTAADPMLEVHPTQFEPTGRPGRPQMSLHQSPSRVSDAEKSSAARPIFRVSPHQYPDGPVPTTAFVVDHAS